MASDATSVLLSDDDGGADLTSRLGRRLHAGRLARGLTLAQLAGSSGVSVSHLSTIERGNTAPSLPVLGRITEALGISISEALGEDREAAVRIATMDSEPGHRSVGHDELELAIELHNAARGSSGKPPVPHGSDRDLFLYVRSGDLTVLVDGEPYLLGPGDSLDAIGPGAVDWSAEGEVACLWASAARGLDARSRGRDQS